LRRTPFHNDYLTFLVKEGLVGLIAFCVLIGSAVTRTVFAARAPLLDRDDRLFGLAMLGALMVYLGNMVFAPIIVLPYAATLFWLLVGAAFVLPPVTIAGRSRTLDSRHIEPVEATADAV
jgi:O-antigen ligase